MCGTAAQESLVTSAGTSIDISVDKPTRGAASRSARSSPWKPKPCAGNGPITPITPHASKLAVTWGGGWHDFAPNAMRKSLRTHPTHRRHRPRKRTIQYAAAHLGAPPAFHSLFVITGLPAFAGNDAADVGVKELNTSTFRPT